MSKLNYNNGVILNTPNVNVNNTPNVNVNNTPNVNVNNTPNVSVSVGAAVITTNSTIGTSSGLIYGGGYRYVIIQNISTSFQDIYVSFFAVTTVNGGILIRAGETLILPYTTNLYAVASVAGAACLTTGVA